MSEAQDTWDSIVAAYAADTPPEPGERATCCRDWIEEKCSGVGNPEFHDGDGKRTPFSERLERFVVEERVRRCLAAMAGRVPLETFVAAEQAVGVGARLVRLYPRRIALFVPRGNPIVSNLLAASGWERCPSDPGEDRGMYHDIDMIRPAGFGAWSRYLDS